MAYFVSGTCVFCQRCMHECPVQAIVPGPKGVNIIPEKCTECGICAEICPEGCIFSEDNPPVPAIHHPVIKKECDVVVLGGGGAGLVAAARLGYFSGKKVIVLEKRRKTGGGAQYAADFRVYNSRWQRDRGIPDVTNQKLREVMDQTHWLINPRLAWNTFKATGEFFDWLCDTGENVGDLYIPGTYIFDGPDGPKIPAFKKDHQGGNYVMQRMFDLCEKNGVEILTGHRAVDVIVENRKITRVIAEDEGGQTIINCNACILATGSWIRNKQILEKHTPKFAKVPVGDGAHTHPSYTGDGIPLAEKANAFIDYENFCIRLMGPLPMVLSRTVMSIVMEPYPIQVNKNGERWINELTQKRLGIFETGTRLIDQPDFVSYYIFDESILETAVQRFRSGAKYEWCFPSPPSYPDDYKTDIEKAMDSKSGMPGMPGNTKALFRADSIRELAEQAGIDPVQLQKTIEHYNRICEKKCDEEFFKDPEHLLPLIKAPFYAVRGGLGTDGAFGGVLVNENIQAISMDGNPVEGLYVPGDFSSGRYINVKGNKVQIINDLSWAFASGWIAAKSAEKYLNRSSI